MPEDMSERMSEDNVLTSYSAFGFNRLSAERSVGIRHGSNSLEVYWHVWCLLFIYVWQVVSWHDLACLSMPSCCCKLLTLLVEVYWLVCFLFPRICFTGGLLTWFGMFEHAFLLLQTFDLASGGPLTCLSSVSSYMFDRSYPDMIWHVWACAVAVAKTFDLASGGLLTCLISVSSYVWQVVSWHVLACLSMRRCCCFHFCFPGVLLMSGRQEMTSVQQ